MADEEQPQTPTPQLKGHLWMLIVVGVLGFLCVVIIATAAALIGDRTGVGSNKGMVGIGSNPNLGSALPQGAGCNNVPIFKQCDSRWGGNSYNCGTTTICSSGCGVTAAAMVLSFYGKNVDPAIMAQDSMDHGYRACGSGTSHGFFPYVAKEYGLKDENGISWSRAMDLLKQGKPIIVSGIGSPPFTSHGHFIVLTCYNSDGTISVNDPAGGAKRDTSYPESHIQSYQHFVTAIYP